MADVLQLYTLRHLAVRVPRYGVASGDGLVELATGRFLHADRRLGFYVDDTGVAVAPGFVTYAGFENFSLTESLGDHLLRKKTIDRIYGLLAANFTLKLLYNHLLITYLLVQFIQVLYLLLFVLR